ncbi:LPS translocon maturation chaperone LptM [Psychrobacter sp. I-STPA10]|uniref:LPS translocon maturation chaperone LptM n=1 Tax=Psychrobacter sp. I-STPA10 TaxID=2585769 RepID=UPI001E5BC636|nr:lipoprotein [Psychrobacter sp. I-STPA10]
MRKYHQPQSLVTQTLDMQVSVSQISMSFIHFTKTFFSKANFIKTTFISITSLSIIVLAVTALTGCGQKGDLYLPDTNDNQNTAQALPQMSTETNPIEVNNDNLVDDAQDY